MGNQRNMGKACEVAKTILNALQRWKKEKEKKGVVDIVKQKCIYKKREAGKGKRTRIS